MPNEDRIRRVYDLLTEAYDIPQPFEEVQNKWQTSPESRRKAYDLLTEAYEIQQPYEEFEQLFAPGYNEQGQAAATAAPSKPTPKQGDMEGKTQPSTVAQTDTAARVVAGGGYTPRSIVPSSKEGWDDISKRAGELKAEEKAKKEQLEQAKAQSVAAAQEQQDYVNTELRKAQREERKAKWRSLGDALLRSASAAPSMTATSAAVAGGMSPSQQMAMEGAAEAFKEYGEHKLVAEALDESIDYVNAVAEQRGVGKGAWDYATRIGTFDFGYSDIAKGLTLQQLAEKAESGEPLSEEEERVLDMVAQATYLTQLVQDGVKMGYNVGASLPQSLGFMAGIALNPASGLGRQMMKRAAKKYGDRAFKTMATRALGDVAEMGIATLTTGSGRVLADAIDRVNGDVTYDITPEGYIAYGGQQNQEALWKAAAKAFGTNFIENYTEALGEYFSPLGNMLDDLTSKNLRRMNLGGLVDFINAIPQSQWGKMVGQFMEATKFNGVVGEILEEEIGMFLEPVFVGDSTLAENFNIWSDDPEIADRARDNQLTTILSCALMSGMLYGVQGAGARGKLNRELAHADREGKRLLGEEGWNNIHTLFDSADGDAEKLERLMKDVVYGKELTNEQRTAIVDYAAKMVQTNQFNASNDAAKQEMTKTASELSAAYDAGYRMATLDIPQNFRGVRDDLYWSEDAILEYDKNHLDINLLETAHNLRDADMATREQVVQGLPSEQADLVKTYLACSERFNGLYQGTKDAMEADKMTFIDMVRPAIITNADGQEIVRTATTAYGESVYVVGGEGKVSYILDGNGQKSAYPTDQLKGISETTVEELESQFDKALEDRYMARLEHYTQHNEQTQEPVVGMILGDGNENYVITDMGEGWATIQEAVTDKEGNMVPKPDGKSRDVTKDYLLAFQDQIYDRRDAMDGKPVPSSIPAALQQAADDKTEQVQALRQRAEQWAAATGVAADIYEKAEDIPDKQTQQFIMQQQEAEANGQQTEQIVTGWYDTKTGRIAFYLPNIKDESDLDRTYIHEVISHKGLRELLKDNSAQEGGQYWRFDNLMQRVWDELMTDTDRQQYMDYVKRFMTGDGDVNKLQRAAADEFVASFSETLKLNPTDEVKTLWDKFVEFVRNILDTIGVGSSITNEDLSTLLQASMDRYREQVKQEHTPKDFRGNPLPMRTNKMTGEQVVNANALWQNDPEAWALWNDSQPNRLISSKERLEDSIADLDKQIKKENTALIAAAKKGVDEDKIDEMRYELDKKVKLRQTYQDILARLSQPAAAAETVAGQQRKAAAAETVASAAAGFAGIQENWNKAPKAVGLSDEIVLPNGEMIRGHYVLTEAWAPTPSHNPADGFKMSAGFPVDENGKTVNDRDYEQDKAAQQSVLEKAGNYDQRALQTPVIVTADGVVLSGNDRTMASQLAATGGTDQAYTDYLGKYAQKFGFTEEQVGSMEHPRVLFVPDVPMGYNASTFAKFNAEEKKSQNKVESAVKAGKTISPAALGKLAALVNGYEDINALYNDENGANDLIGIMLEDGYITQEQVAALKEGTKLSGTGMDFLESTLIGAALEEDAVRIVMDDRSMRHSIVSAISQIIDNSTIEDYNLRTELADAIALVSKGKASKVIKFGDTVQDYIRQGNLFEEDVVAEATVQLLADALNNKKTTTLKKVLSLYNTSARDAANGQMSIFSGDVETKDEILVQILNDLGYATRTFDTFKRAEAAREGQDSAGAESGEVGDAGDGERSGEVNRNREFVRAALMESGDEHIDLTDYMSDDECDEFMRLYEEYEPFQDAVGEAYEKYDEQLKSKDKAKKAAAEKKIDKLVKAQEKAFEPIQDYVEDLLSKYGLADVDEVETEEEVPEISVERPGAEDTETAEEQLASEEEVEAQTYTRDEWEDFVYGGFCDTFESPRSNVRYQLLFVDDCFNIYKNHSVKLRKDTKDGKYLGEAGGTTDYILKFFKANGYKRVSGGSVKNKYGYWINEHGVCMNPVKVELPSVKKGWAQMNYFTYYKADDGLWYGGGSASHGDGGGSVTFPHGYENRSDLVKAAIEDFEGFREANAESQHYTMRDVENLIKELKNRTLPQALREEGVLTTPAPAPVQGELFGTPKKKVVKKVVKKKGKKQTKKATAKKGAAQENDIEKMTSADVKARGLKMGDKVKFRGQTATVHHITNLKGEPYSVEIVDNNSEHYLVMLNDWPAAAESTPQTAGTEDTRPLIFGPEPLIKGDKWAKTGEPQKWKAGKRADSHDTYFKLGNKTYGLTKADSDAIYTLAEDYGSLSALWNAYENGRIILFPEQAAAVKAQLSYAESQQSKKPKQKPTESQIQALAFVEDKPVEQVRQELANPSGNKLVTDEQYEKLRERMRQKLNGQMNMGVDPEIFSLGVQMAVYHIEKGARKFVDFAKAMIDELGDAIRPYLKSFYNGARDLPEMQELADDMDSYEVVSQVDTLNFDKSASASIEETAENSVKERESVKNAEKAKKKILDNRSKTGKQLVSLSLADGTEMTFDKNDYQSFMTPEAKSFFETLAEEDEEYTGRPFFNKKLAYITYASDNGAIIPADVLEQLPEFIAAEQRGKELADINGGPMTLSDVERETFAKKLLALGSMDEKGKFTNPVAQEKKAFIVIGRPAGGKSSVFADPLSKEHNARIIDSDIVREWLFGYEQGLGSGYVQEASASVADAAFLQAALAGDNMVIPRIGGPSVISEVAIPLRSAGYTVELLFNEVPERSSIMRAASRFARTGRYLSLQYLQSIGDKPLNVFKKFGTLNIGEAINELSEKQVQKLRGRIESLSGKTGESDGTGRQAGNGSGQETLGADVQTSLGTEGLGSALLNSTLFNRAEWKNNDVPYGEQPKLISSWSSQDRDKTEQSVPTTPQAGDQLTMWDLLDTTNNDNDTGTTQPTQGESEADRTVGGVSAVGDRVLGSEGPGQSDGGEAAGNTAGTAAVAGTEQGSVRTERSGGGSEGITDLGGEEQPELSDGGPSVRSGNAAAGRSAVRRNLKESGEVKKASKPSKRYTRNFSYDSQSTEIDNYTPQQRYKANVEAVEVVAKVLTEGRSATDEEKVILSRFRGWGGVDALRRIYNTNVMRSSGDSLLSRLAIAIDTVDPDGTKGILEAIRTAALTSFYTPSSIARSMNRFVTLAGFKGGSLLDPSMGSGIFEGTMEQDVAQRTMIYGVEKDWLTGQIAKLLYPDGDIKVMGFEEANVPMDAYDVVESNIPFGDFKVTDTSWKGNNTPVRRAAQHRIHNYFAVKMLESTKPGGICVIMTSNAILDTPGNAIIREYIADQSEVVGVIRLPDNTFKGAGTAAVTDVIMLRKFRDEVDRNETRDDADYRTKVLEPFLSTVKTTATADNEEDYEIEYNGYFGTHKDYMIGDVIAGNQYRHDAFGLTSKMSTEDIAAAMDKLTDKIVGKRKGKLLDTVKSERAVYEAVREAYVGSGDYISNGNLVEQDGKFGTVTQTKNKYGETSSTFEELTGLKGKGARLRAMFDVRTAMKKLIAKQIEGVSDDELKELRGELQKAYDKYVKLYGRLNDAENSFIDFDIDAYTLRSLEKYSDDKFVGLSDIFTKNTIKPAIDLSQAKDAQSTISVSLAEYGEIRPAFMENILGEKWFDLCKDFLFEVPFGSGDEYVTRDAYLSGDVKTKLEQARRAADADERFERNVKALEEVQPRDLAFEEISIRMGARWVPQEVYTDFMFELFGLEHSWRGADKSGVRYSPEADMYTVAVETGRLGGEASNWSTNMRSAKDIFEAALEDRTITVKVKDSEGNEHIDIAETEAANQKVQDMRQEFEDWLPRDADRVKELTNLYNDKFNRTVIRKFDGSHLQIPGLMGMELRPHQKDAVWMLINNRGGIVDHMVGAGKTLVMQSAIMEMRRMGIAKKPMIVALKSTVAQITKEFIEAYPSARVLAPTERDFEKKNRKKFLSNIALNDYDCIIVSHEQYVKLPHTEEVETAVIREQLDMLQAALAFMYGTSDTTQLSKRQIKAVEKRIENLKAKMAQLLSREVDREFTFEGLGIDYLFVDECQAFKSLPYVTSYGNVSGLGDATGSQKAVALLNGVRYLQQLHQGDMGTTFLSGTTITNSLVEIYNLLNYLRPREMRRLGLTTFDAWANTFAEQSSELEYGVTTELKSKARFRRFDNVPELSRLYAEIADVRNDMNLKLPKPQPRMHIETVPASDKLKEINQVVIDMVKRKDGNEAYAMGLIKNVTNEKSPYGLLASGISTKAAISLKLLSEDFDDEGGKVGYVCENVAKIYKQFNEQKGTQLIFCDTGVPGTTPGKYNVYDDIIDRLTKDYGIPREEIVDIHVADTDKKRKELFQKVREGKVRILIGGTKNMGTGVNVQTRVVAMHHIDVPWTPADREQREGRGVRQGNEVAKEFNDNMVDIYFYAAEESLDVYKYQLQDIKGRMFTQFKMGTIGNAERSFDEGSGGEDGTFDPAEVVALLSGNPVILEKSKQDKLVEKLRRAKRTYETEYRKRKADAEKWSGYLREQQAFKTYNSYDIEQLERNGFVKDAEGKYPVNVIVEDASEYGTRRSFDKAKDAGEYIHRLLKKPGAQVRLSGFGQTAYVRHEPLETATKPGWEVTTTIRSSIPYRVKLSDDDTAAGSAFRSLLERVINSRSVYQKNIDEAEHKLQGLDPGEMNFPKQAELDAAEEKKKQLDAEYKKLSQDDEKPEPPTDGGPDGGDEGGERRYRMANRNTEVFISNAARAVGSITQDKATPDQWLAMIQKQGGLKAAEDKWIGLSEWIRTMKEMGARTLTKDEISQYIDANKIKVEEVWYGEDIAMKNLQNKYPDFEKAFYIDVEDFYGVAYVRVHDEDTALDLYNRNNPDDRITRDEASGELTDSEYNKIEQWGNDVLNTGINGINSTRQHYQTEGLVNNREIALTVPTIEPWNENDVVHFGDAGKGRAVAWARFGDALDEDGGRVLFIDEIQSKRHQEGRKVGYKNSHPFAEAKIGEYERYDDEQDVAMIIGPSGTTIGKMFRDQYGYSAENNDGTQIVSARKTEQEALEAMDKVFMKDGIPDAPFDKNWQELAMKRMLRLAAEEGYDKVAWTTGEQQEARYNLAGFLRSVRVKPSIMEDFIDVELNYKNRRTQHCLVNEQGQVVSGAFYGHNLDEVIGKDLAMEIMAVKEEKTFEGNNLKVSNRGMLAFYDRMLPEFMDKYGKQWGVKTKDELLTLDDGAKLEAHVVDVTPEMRESVMQGQVMFRMVTDPALIDKLESGKKVKVYRAMQQIDGKLYPPMAAQVDGQLVEPIELGKWEQAVERPDLIKGNKFKLNKGNGSSLEARYNPYIHTSRSPLNDQFTSAYDRPNLVTVEVEIPESELTSGYKAEGAKDAVGEMTWHSGPVSGKLPKEKQRKVILSRYDKPLRIVPDSEVAELIAQLLEGENIAIPYNTVTPSLREELEKRGVAISDEPSGKVKNETPKNTTISDVLYRMVNHNSAYLLKKADGSFYDPQTKETLGFDNRFIGVGQGSVAHGYGSYFSVRDIREYASNDHNVTEDVKVNGKTYRKNRVWWAQTYIRKEGVDRAIELIKEGVSYWKEKGGDAQYSIYKSMLEVAEAVKNGDVTLTELSSIAGSHHYDVEIPDDTGSNYLEEMRTLPKEQRRRIADAVRKLDGEPAQSVKYVNYNNGWESLADMIEDRQWAYLEIRDRLVAALGGRADDERRLSELMSSVGYVGVHYDGHYDGECYVIFKPEDAKIVNHVMFRMVTPEQDELKAAEQETDTNPTDGQKEAGNYKKGHVRLFGMDLSIEQPKGSVRRGTDPDGKEWEQEMHNTYGYIRGTMGRDKDHIDVFLGDNLSSDKVFVVDQRNVQNGSFDEHKVMLGFDDIESARAAYNNNYEDGWTGLGAITETSLDAFKTWAFKEGRRVQPFSQTEGDGSVLFRMREPSEYKRIEDALGVAAVRYERAMDEAGKRMAEVMSDSMRSVKELQDAIAEQTGRPIRDFENAYWAAIQYSSRNKAMQDAYHKKFYRPLLDEVYSLTKDAKDREEALDKLNAYLMAKHGLERNEKFAMRDAERDALEQLPEEPRTPDEFDDTEVMEEYDSKYAKWKSEFDKLRDVLYDKYRRRDYSGLTALFEKKKVVEAEIDAQLLVDSYEKEHDTTELWRLINAATKETLRTSVQGGVITQEKYIELANMFDNYVPLRGFDETTSDDVYGYYGTVNSPYNTAIKKAYGRRSLSDSPLATIGNIADSEIMRANRNRIYMAALSLAENHHTGLMSVSEVMFRRDPDTGEWSIALPDLSDADTPELVAQKMSDFRKWFAEQLLTDDVNYRLSSEMARVPYKVINKSALDEHQIIAMRGGKQYIITVNGNPRAAQALAGKTNPDSSPALNWLAPFNRFLAGVFTQYNPSFVLRNLTRDGIYTNAMVWAKEDRKYALAFNKNWSRVLANMAGLLSKYKSELLDDSQPIERYFREFIDNGGETGYTQLRSVKDYKKIMKRELKDIASASPAAAGRKVMSVLGEAVENMNRWAEGVSRYAAFLTSREQGRSVVRSVEDAKEISVNFNKKGSGTAALTDKDRDEKLLLNVARVSQLGRELFVFFNAGVQGMANFTGIVKNNPQKAVPLLTGLFLGGAALAMMNGGGGDDDDEKDYYNLPEYIRRSNICLKAGKHWLTVPMPIELRCFYGLGELAYSVMSGNEFYEGKELAYEVASQLTQILPIDFLEGNQGTMAFVPSAVKPIVEAYWLNQDWTGTPIYNDSPFNENDPAWRKAFKSTSPALVTAARKLNEWTGGNVGRSGVIDINPARVEHLFEGYLGGVGTIMNQVYKSGRALTGDLDMREVRNIPVVSGFMRDSDGKAGVRAENSRYHKINDMVDGIMNEDRRLRQVLAEKEISGYDYDDKAMQDARERLQELRQSKEWEFAQRWRSMDKARNAAREGRDEEEFNKLTKEMNEVYMEFRRTSKD